MGSCSEESLLWTDASNDNYSEADDSRNSTEERGNTAPNNKIVDMSTKSSKRVIEESSDDAEAPKRKKIKIEPESDNDSALSKKHISESVVDESYLQMRVKQENGFLIPPVMIKKEKDKKKISQSNDKHEFTKSGESLKNNNTGVENIKTKKKSFSNEIETERRSESEVSSIINHIDTDELVEFKIKKEKDKKKKSLHQTDGESCHTESEESIVNNNTGLENFATYKKKKKKKKKSESENSIDVKGTIIKEYFSAEETVVESPHKRKKKKKKSRGETNAYNSDDQSFSQYESNGLNTLEESQISVINQSSTHNDNHDMSKFENTQHSVCEPEDNRTQDSIEKSSERVSVCEPEDNRTQDSIEKSSERVSVCEPEDYSAQDSILPEKSSERVSKISDRIKFEDDSTEDKHFQDISKIAIEESDEIYGTMLNNYIKNKKLKSMKYKIPKHKLITEDDDVWVFRVPRTANVETIKDATLNLNRKFKTKIDGHRYECTIDEDNKDVVLFTYNGNKTVIKNIAIQGIITCKKKIPKSHIIEDKTIVNKQTDFMPLPETKCRHPIFGSNYKNEIKLPDEVQQRLNDVETITIKREKKKKSKKRKISEVHVKFEEPKGEDVVDSISFVKEKKKRKHSNHEKDDEVPMKKKRHKTSEDPSALWDSEKAIEENLFNF